MRYEHTSPDEKRSPSSSSFQRVARDVMELIELQTHLISVDSQAARRKLVRAMSCGAAAAVIAGSALTVAIIAGGFLLDESTSLSTGGAMLVISLVSFVIVGLLGWVGLHAIASAAESMSETKSEFAENLRWIKATLISPQTSPRNQIRRDSFDDATSDPYQFHDFPERHSHFQR